MLKICTLALLGLLTASGSVACGTGTTGRGNQEYRLPPSSGDKTTPRLGSGSRQFDRTM